MEAPVLKRAKVNEEPWQRGLKMQGIVDLMTTSELKKD